MTLRAMPGAVFVAAYLASVVAANVGVATFGAAGMLVASWVVIPFDLTAKDVLQQRWTGRGLLLRMAGLVLCGSALSAALSADVAHIALASAAAFAASGAVDSVVLHCLRDRGVLARVNGSNVAGALVDSLVFQALVLAQLQPAMVLAQAASKVLGGVVWSVLLRRHLVR